MGAKTDIAVIGGGPAGLAFAIEAQSLGFNVTIIDRGRTSPVFGEVLNSQAKYSLQRLGVYENFVREHKSIVGKRSRWGTDVLRESSTIFSPHGADWLLDRPKFECLLRKRAVTLGVRLISDHILDVRRDSTEWIVKLRSGVGLSCSFLVDASGRSMWLSRRISSPPVIVDRLMAVSLFSRSSDTSVFFEVESFSEGWWFRAPLPDGGAVLMLMTDRDLIPPNIEEEATRARLGKSLNFIKGSVRPAYTAYASYATGDGWAAIGDAALAWDPLAGQGITSALDSAHSLANALKQRIAGDDTSLDKYAQDIKSGIRKYLIERAGVYRSENRWKESSFWRRRHSSAL